MPFSVFYNRMYVWSLECGIPFLRLCWLAVITKEGPETGSPFLPSCIFLQYIGSSNTLKLLIKHRISGCFRNEGDILMVYSS
jgi:hypothetical protein